MLSLFALGALAAPIAQSFGDKISISLSPVSVHGDKSSAYSSIYHSRDVNETRVDSYANGQLLVANFLGDTHQYTMLIKAFGPASALLNCTKTTIQNSLAYSFLFNLGNFPQKAKGKFCEQQVTTYTGDFAGQTVTWSIAQNASAFEPVALEVSMDGKAGSAQFIVNSFDNDVDSDVLDQFLAESKCTPVRETAGNPGAFLAHPVL